MSAGPTGNIKLSIVIPAYNAEAWINTAVKSAVGSYGGNFEVICVNDGSTDATPFLLDELAKAYPCVKVLHQQNAGRSVARNVGIQNASGEWIGFLDADDRIMPRAFDLIFSHALEQVGCVCFRASMSRPQFGLFARPGCDTDFSDPVMLDADDAIQFLSDPSYYLATHDVVARNRRLLGSFDPLWCWTVFTKLWRSSLLKESGIQFEEGLTFAEDVLFIHEYLSRTQCRALFLPNETHVYNNENEGTTRGYSMGDMKRLIPSFEAFSQRLLYLDHPEALAWRCVQDMVFISVRAVKYCSCLESRREIRSAFFHPAISEFCGYLSKGRFVKMGDSIWLIWLWAFEALRTGWFNSYWHACHVIAGLENLMGRIRGFRERAQHRRAIV